MTSRGQEESGVPMNGAVFKYVLIDIGKEKAHTLSFPAALPPAPGWASLTSPQGALWEGGREKVHSQTYHDTQQFHSSSKAALRVRGIGNEK